MSKRHAIVLSGGGAFGAYQVGVMKALSGGMGPSARYRSFEPDIYTGTSVGAYNATFLASQWEGSSADGTLLLERIWRELISDQGDGRGNGVYRWRLNPFKFLNPRNVIRFPLRTLMHLIEDSVVLAQESAQRATWLLNATGEPIPNRLAGLFDLAAFVSLEPLVETFAKTIDLGEIRRTPKTLRVAVTNWTTGELEIVQNRELNELGLHLVKGSVSIPGIFPPEVIDQKHFVDGGVLMNTPIQPAIAADADVLHIVEPYSGLTSLRALSSTVGATTQAQSLSWSFTVDSEIKEVAVGNAALEAVEAVRRYLTNSDLDPESSEVAVRKLSEAWRKARRRVGLAAHRELTVHRYRPNDSSGEGPLEILDFRRENIEATIERGFRETIEHDCRLNGCLSPAASAVKAERRAHDDG